MLNSHLCTESVCRHFVCFQKLSLWDPQVKVQKTNANFLDIIFRQAQFCRLFFFRWRDDVGKMCVKACNTQQVQSDMDCKWFVSALENLGKIAWTLAQVRLPQLRGTSQRDARTHNRNCVSFHGGHTNRLIDHFSCVQRAWPHGICPLDIEIKWCCFSLSRDSFAQRFHPSLDLWRAQHLHVGRRWGCDLLSCSFKVRRRSFEPLTFLHVAWPETHFQL